MGSRRWCTAPAVWPGAPTRSASASRPAHAAAGINQSNTHVGWTVGGGVEWALIDNWTAKVEYLYVKLDNETYFANTCGNGLGFDADLDVHTVKVGLNYRFGYGKAPVVAKY